MLIEIVSVYSIDSIVCSNVTCATFAPVLSCAHEPAPQNIFSPDLFLH